MESLSTAPCFVVSRVWGLHQTPNMKPRRLGGTAFINVLYIPEPWIKNTSQTLEFGGCELISYYILWYHSLMYHQLCADAKSARIFLIKLYVVHTYYGWQNEQATNVPIVVPFYLHDFEAQESCCCSCTSWEGSTKKEYSSSLAIFTRTGTLNSLTWLGSRANWNSHQLQVRFRLRIHRRSELPWFWHGFRWILCRWIMVG
jgi:hypothetical protein